MKWMMIIFSSLLLISCASSPKNNGVGYNYQTSIKIANDALKTNNFRIALRAYKTAMEQAPEQLEPFVGLATLYEKVHAYHQAANVYQKALSLPSLTRKQSIIIKRKLGIDYLQAGNIDMALSQWFDALSSANKKQKGKIYNDLGVLLDRAGYHGHAQACYRQGLAYAPKDADLKHNLELSSIGVKSKKPLLPIDDKLSAIEKICGYSIQISPPLSSNTTKQASNTANQIDILPKP